MRPIRKNVVNIKLLLMFIGCIFVHYLHAPQVKIYILPQGNPREPFVVFWLEPEYATVPHTVITIDKPLSIVSGNSLDPATVPLQDQKNIKLIQQAALELWETHLTKIEQEAADAVKELEELLKNWEAHLKEIEQEIPKKTREVEELLKKGSKLRDYLEEIEEMQEGLIWSQNVLEAPPVGDKTLFIYYPDKNIMLIKPFIGNPNLGPYYHRLAQIAIKNYHTVLSEGKIAYKDLFLFSPMGYSSYERDQKRMWEDNQPFPIEPTVLKDLRTLEEWYNNKKVADQKTAQLIDTFYHDLIALHTVVQ